MSRKKKVLEDSPVMDFISGASIIAEDPEPEKPEEPESEAEMEAETIPEGYKKNPLYIEKKTKRVQLIMQPSLYEKLKAAAASEGESLNNYIHELLASCMNSIE